MLKCSILYLWLSCLCFAGSFEWKQGDIIMQEGKSSQSKMIKAATKSKWTHVGMIVIDPAGKKRVLEAVQPVKFTSVNAFLKRSKSYKVLRLKKSIKLDASMQSKGRTYILKQIGKNYDAKFKWGDDRMYCSELVWKCYKHIFNVELCKPRPYESYNLKHPAVQKVIRERFGSVKKLPKNHKVVAPSDIATSTLLEEVK